MLYYNYKRVFCFFIRKSIKNIWFLGFACQLLKNKKLSKSDFFHFLSMESYFLKY